VNDPHVESLTYRLRETDSLAFEAPPIEFETAAFRARLADNVLTLRPKEHFASEEDVRAIADEFVRAWEIDAGLGYGRPDFRFQYDGAQLVDRAPSPGHHMIASKGVLHLSGSAHLKVTRAKYPIPSEQFVATPEVQVLWERYSRYLAGKEPLLAMAYFGLTLLERGDRRRAARDFRIDVEVLRKLGELTSTRGDGLTARKMSTGVVPLTGPESQWVEATIKAIIRHIATLNSGASLSLADLPPLP